MRHVCAEALDCNIVVHLQRERKETYQSLSEEGRGAEKALHQTKEGSQSQLGSRHKSSQYKCLQMYITSSYVLSQKENSYI